MASFSQRYGYTSAESAFQRESMDQALKTRLWNILAIDLWDRYETSYSATYGRNPIYFGIVRGACIDHFNVDGDLIDKFYKARDLLKEVFFACVWHSVYDLLEYLCQDERVVYVAPKLEEKLNSALQSHNAAYRIIKGCVAEITDKNEIVAIEDALNVDEQATRTHISTALRMLSDKEAPDYRNSVKESISAVEAACRRVTGNPKATLADALKKIRDIHPAFNKSMALLYGYAGDGPGIRHALSDEAQITYADAKYMLVTCSAFVSYLLQSASDELVQ